MVLEFAGICPEFTSRSFRNPLPHPSPTTSVGRHLQLGIVPTANLPSIPPESFGVVTCFLTLAVNFVVWLGLVQPFVSSRDTYVAILSASLANFVMKIDCTRPQIGSLFNGLMWFSRLLLTSYMTLEDYSLTKKRANMKSIVFYLDEENQREEPYQVTSDGEDNHGSIFWHQDDYSDSESRNEPDREAPEPERPDSYNTSKGYSKPWIKLNDDFCSHGSKSPLTRVIYFSRKENYLKWEEDIEYKGATTKEYHYQRPRRREEKPNHHILSHRVPTTSCQAKPRDKYTHTNPRVVHEVTQKVPQGASIWLKQHPRGRRDYLAERDSRTSKLRGGKLKNGASRDPLLSNPTRSYKTKLRLSLNNGYEYFGPECFEFTGRERDYLQWELYMDKYFRYYSIPKEERLNYCHEQLMGSAKRWWNREKKDRRWYKEPSLKTWEQLKLLMRERYAPHMLSQPVQNSYLPKEPSRENTTHQHVSSDHNADQDSAKKNEKGTYAKGDSSSIPLLKPHAEPHAELKKGLCHSMDDKSKEVDHYATTLKEVENGISFEEQLSETTTTSQVCRNRIYDQAALKGRVMIHPCSTPTDLASKIIHIKAELIPNTLHGTNKEHTEHKGDSPEVRKVTDQIQSQSEPAPLMLTPSIMETRRVSNSCLIKEEPSDFKSQAQTREGVKQATRQLKAPDQNRRLILSFLLKGEPPNAPCITKPPPYQGFEIPNLNDPSWMNDSLSLFTSSGSSSESPSASRSRSRSVSPSASTLANVMSTSAMIFLQPSVSSQYVIMRFHQFQLAQYEGVHRFKQSFARMAVLSLGGWHIGRQSLETLVPGFGKDLNRSGSLSDHLFSDSDFPCIEDLFSLVLTFSVVPLMASIQHESFSRPSISSVLAAEVLSLKVAISAALALGVSRLACYSDCQDVILLLNAGGLANELEGILADISELSSKFSLTSCSISSSDRV
ncbi:hypothetical protein ISN45_Aa06g028660 [Arabidopsis thaliana x Arabidopsis arenosa]|uniref:Uncharacterized protein n=1 Tax=Arabidopsis thaliana x Arabidopsis arenosa TaxID=1240361 RepID=A0A8T1Z0U0_9BRAS|nr:hypothetical protein ISN45_Aa06g028660 [Arabidopsis thaliana x Arabidopsis arenosa]